MIQYIEGKMLRDMFVSGANNLQNHKELVDKLNVFPVPDGDTGTNMSLTISYAMKELAKVENDSITEIGKSLSKGSLMGARGNSGVILSQIIRGFSKSIEGKEQISTEDLAKAFKNGSDTAYKAVIKPIEGTILTVVRESGEYAIKAAKKEKDLLKFLEMVIDEANKSLERTPELLKNLKEAGVVDSGGKGLVLIYEGMYEALKGNPIKAKDLNDSNVSEVKQAGTSINTEDIKFCYCTEFILESNSISDTEIRDIMLKYGDSLAVVGDEGIIKVHVHTNDPGLVLQDALKHGQLVTIKIENMKLQHENILVGDTDEIAQSVEEKEYGFIATSMGEGLAKIFKDFGVDYIIEGGQTMNPSTEDMLNAIEKVNAKNIFILPNNKNIIMAANQAASLTEDKNIIVIPTKTIPQGITALVNYIPDSTPEDNAERMGEEIQLVKTGQVTYAVRDTVIDDKEIKQDDYMGIGDKGILSVGTDMEKTVLEMIGEMIDEDSAILSIYYGEEMNEDSANEIAEKVEEEYPDVEVEVHYGGQPIYYYIASVE